MQRTWLYGVALVVAALGLLAAITMLSGDVVGVVDSQRIMEEFVVARVQKSLEEEAERLQSELDQAIAETAELPVEERVPKVDELKEEYQRRLDEYKTQLVEPKIQQVKTVIKEVASARRVDMVIDNASQLVLYGGVDLTDEVLEELGK
ncbi:MAG: OmpH family outer membrane protein [Firmicutes bacterium]|nr:OmpH family outer membrane protein [Bacillota bacterium]